MSISVNSSFMAYAKSMEGKSLEGYSRLSSKILRSKVGNSNVTTSASQKSDEAENGRTGGGYRVIQTLQIQMPKKR